MQARIADCYRDVGLPPPEASDFERRSRRLDIEGWRLLALAWRPSRTTQFVPFS